MSMSVFAIQIGMLVLLSAMGQRVFAQAEAPPDALAVLANWEQKAGSSKASTVKSLLFSGSMKAQGMPGGASFQEAHLGPRAKLSMKFPGMGETNMGTTGDWSWSTDPVMGVTIREGKEQASFLRLFAIARGASWKLLYKSAAASGTVDSNGRKLLEIKMVTPEEKTESWFIDVAKNELVRVDLPLPNPTGGTIPSTWIYEDWKEVNGTLYAHRRIQKVESIAITYEVSKVEQNLEIAGKSIEPSEEVVAAAKNPKLRQAEAPENPGDCNIEDLTERPTATIRTKTKPGEVSKTLASILPEVGMYLGSGGGEMAGAPFTRYHSISDSEIDLEAGFVVRKPITPKGRIQASTLPGGKAAMTWHFGPYEKLKVTHEVLSNWIKSEKLEPSGPIYEFYWTDPGIEPDPAKWKTQIFWPVR